MVIAPVEPFVVTPETIEINYFPVDCEEIVVAPPRPFESECYYPWTQQGPGGLNNG